MDYQNTLKYLYESAPMFQQIGGKAYKPGLETTHKLDEHLGHPHQEFRTIHIAGTNGKGSCSHTIAAVLQAAGYKVGLFTSPHLIDFRERIRINGEMIPEEYVVNFVEDHRSFFEPLHPSFFELTTAMAFRYFADQKVVAPLLGRAGYCRRYRAESSADFSANSGWYRGSMVFRPDSGRRAYFFVLSRKGAFVYEGTTRKNPAGSARRAGKRQGRRGAGRAARALSRQEGRADRRFEDDGQAVRRGAPRHGSGREQRPRRH